MNPKNANKKKSSIQFIYDEELDHVPPFLSY